MDLIYSWTPREFKNFIKGAQLRRIDALEMLAVQAMFSANAANARRLKLKDLYDAEKARRNLENGLNETKPALDLDRYRKAQAAMKAYRPQNSNMKKGG